MGIGLKIFKLISQTNFPQYIVFTWYSSGILSQLILSTSVVEIVTDREVTYYTNEILSVTHIFDELNADQNSRVINVWKSSSKLSFCYADFVHKVYFPYEIKPTSCPSHGCPLPGWPPSHCPVSPPHNNPHLLQQQALACHWHPGHSGRGVRTPSKLHVPLWER